MDNITEFKNIVELLNQHYEVSMLDRDDVWYTELLAIQYNISGKRNSMIKEGDSLHKELVYEYFEYNNTIYNLDTSKYATLRYDLTNQTKFSYIHFNIETCTHNVDEIPDLIDGPEEEAFQYSLVCEPSVDLELIKQAQAIIKQSIKETLQ